MTIHFDYEDMPYDRAELRLQTDDSFRVYVGFDVGTADCVGIGNGDAEFCMNKNRKSSQEIIKGIHVRVNSELVSLAKIFSEAESQFSGVASEVEEEAEYEIAMERELSSPYLSGRI